MNEHTNAAILDAVPLPPRLRALGLISPTEYAEIERLRAARFYLVRNCGPVDGPLKCGRCGVIHTYLTWMCIEQPFSGLDDALYAYTKVSRDPEEKRTLIEGLNALNGPHPMTARELLGEGNREDIFGIAVGLVEPISEATARRFARLIRARDSSWSLVALSSR